VTLSPAQAMPAIRRVTGLALALAGGAVAFAVAAAGQPAADFYRSHKTLTMVVSSSAGGGYDGYARMFGRYMSRYLPGNPVFVINNMPGAGGARATSYLYSVAPRDGSVIGIVNRGAPTIPLLVSGDSSVKYDATKFSWVGNAQRDYGAAVVTNASPAQSMEEAKKVEVVIGASGTDGDSGLLPRMFNELFGTKFKVIAGYPGMTEAIIAMERGEVHGIMANGWGGPTTETMVRMHRTKAGKIIIQLALEPKPEMPGVPLPMDFVTREEDRSIIETVLSRMEVGRPFFAPPEIPPDRLALLREAFDKAAADPELVVEAERTQLYVNPMTGVQSQEIMERLYATPRPILDRIQKMFNASK
jgi:tripartite-type tricarboxylate transporter receptor subunit TctC